MVYIFRSLVLLEYDLMIVTSTILIAKLLKQGYQYKKIVKHFLISTTELIVKTI